MFKHRIYKFDIKSFFERLDTALLLKELWLVPEVPRSALSLLANYFDELRDRNIPGLPRGVQLSAILSEFALKQFDREVPLLPDVYPRPLLKLCKSGTKAPLCYELYL